jgi:hypothetical protein
MTVFLEKIKTLSDKFMLTSYIEGKTEDEIWQFTCFYFLGVKNIDVSTLSRKAYNRLVDDALGSMCYLLGEEDREDIYQLSVEYCQTRKEKNI